MDRKRKAELRRDALHAAALQIEKLADCGGNFYGNDEDEDEFTRQLMVIAERVRAQLGKR